MKKDLIKQSLLERKAELAGRIEALNRDKQKALDPDAEERAVELQNSEVKEHLDQIEIASLAKVNAALARLESDQFGICQECGEMISEKRLMAMPEALSCMNCEAELNQ